MKRVYSITVLTVIYKTVTANSAEEVQLQYPNATEIHDVTNPCRKCGCPAEYVADHMCGPCEECHGYSAWHVAAGTPHVKYCETHTDVSCAYCEHETVKPR